MISFKFYIPSDKFLLISVAAKKKHKFLAMRSEKEEKEIQKSTWIL